MKSRSGRVNIVSIVSLTLLVFMIFYLFLTYTKFSEELEKKNSTIQALETQVDELQTNVSSLKQEVERAKSLLQNISKEELKNPSWEELKTFLELDDTNKLIYDKEKFDCSGFAIELFKHARALGMKAGFVELQFVGEAVGHTLNAFQTDKGLIFVDATGDENGTGEDKIAYVEVGKPYAVIELEGVKERIIDCSIDCRQLTKDLNYINYSNMFSYDYFTAYKKCKELYETCGSFYNQEVEKFNKGESSYSYPELENLYQNLMKLKEEITRQNVYIFSESGIVKNMKIYW